MNCSQLYIGADAKLIETRSEVFTVELVPSASREAKEIRGVLGSRYIYYLAPHTGCGCGWDFLDVGTPSDELSRQSCEALGRFLAALDISINARIYSVCIDSVGRPPLAESAVTVAEFMMNLRGLRVAYASADARVYALVSEASFAQALRRGST